MILTARERNLIHTRKRQKRNDPMQQILKVLVGSRAHGLSVPNSDYDYRGVYVVPTAQILSLRGSQNHFDVGKTESAENIDEASWEIGHFLELATKCNPTILETFLAPVENITEEGMELRALFSSVWNSRGVRDAFCGFAHSQQKRMLEGDIPERQNKFAAAYLRTIFQGYDLLSTGKFVVRVSDSEIGETLRSIRAGTLSMGEIIDLCEKWKQKLEQAYDRNPNKQTNLDTVNQYLLEIRKKNL